MTTIIWDSGEFCPNIIHFRTQQGVGHKYTFLWYFLILLFYDDVMVLKKNGSISSSNSNDANQYNRDLFCELYRLLAVSVDRMLIFIVLIFPIQRKILYWNCFISNLWIWPLKSGLLSSWVCYPIWNGSNILVIFTLLVICAVN